MWQGECRNCPLPPHPVTPLVAGWEGLHGRGWRQCFLPRAGGRVPDFLSWEGDPVPLICSSGQQGSSNFYPTYCCDAGLALVGSWTVDSSGLVRPVQGAGQGLRQGALQQLAQPVVSCSWGCIQGPGPQHHTEKSHNTAGLCPWSLPSTSSAKGSQHGPPTR